MNKLKRYIYIFFLFVINYFLITAVVFTFSYLSLINGKTFDLFWIKSIQKKLYFKGYRNIWQYKNDCAVYDKYLLYKPKEGKCIFKNSEFETELNFDKFSRNHNNTKKNIDQNNYILVLGDSVGMGWGVNDEETFAYHLEKLSKKKVYNMSVSSYGTVREIKRMKLSPYYENSKTIIIQYHPNDLGENKNLNFDTTYEKTDYDNFFKNSSNNPSNIKLILRIYKSSLRLFFSDLNDIIFREKNLELHEFEEHQKFLEHIIKKNIDLDEKKVLVILVLQPWQKVINFPKNTNKIKYKLIKLEKLDFFNIDDHPNSSGHLKIAKSIFNYLN